MRSTVWSRNTQWTSLWWRRSRGSERRTAGWRPTTDSPIQSMFNCAALSRAPHPGLCPSGSKVVFIFHMVMGCGLNLLMVVSQPETRKSSVRIELKWRTPPSCRPRCCLLPEEDEQRAALFSPSLPPSVRLWRLNTSRASCCWQRLQHHRFEWSCVFYSNGTKR